MSVNLFLSLFVHICAQIYFIEDNFYILKAVILQVLHNLKLHKHNSFTGNGFQAAHCYYHEVKTVYIDIHLS